MKQLFSLMLFVSILSVTFTSCKKDEVEKDENKQEMNLSGTVITTEANAEFDSIKAIITNGEDELGELSTSTVDSDKKFSLQLGPPSADKLVKLKSIIVDNHTKISNPEVKIAFIAIIATKADKNVGYLTLGTAETMDNGKKRQTAEITFMYVNDAVTISDTGKDGDYQSDLNLALKKGWNITEQTIKRETISDQTGNMEITTSKWRVIESIPTDYQWILDYHNE